MALTDIPALDSSYPLFSLSDWPNSQAALVSGGLTSEFEKECWNAIISHLEQAFTAAGLEWDNTYTTAAAAQITEEYGDLYAKAVNSLRRNIDILVPLRWNWASDPTFRGYIGRKDFRGVDAYGEKSADDVYPEYIFELVDRLNFLISVLTGESAAIIPGCTDLSETIQAVELLAREAALLGASGYGLSSSEGGLLARASAPLYVGEIVRSLYDAALRKGYAAPFDHSWLLRSDYEAAMGKGHAGNLGGHRYTLNSLMQAEMDIYNVRVIYGKERTFSAYGGSMAQFPPLPMGFTGLYRSLSEASGASVAAFLLIGSGKSTAIHSGTVAPVESCRMSAAGTAKTACSAVPSKLGIAAMGHKSKVVSIHSAALKQAVDLGAAQANSRTLVAAVLYLKPPGPVWNDPVQTGSNLYISSVWFSWNDGSGLQIDTVEFYPPVRDGSDLYIRSAWNSYQDQSEACIDMDVFYKPAQTDGDLYIRSVDNLWTDGEAANVDTDYFLDPVQTGSDLYIRSDVFGG